MELWIRSQDKTVLRPQPKLGLAEGEGLFYIVDRYDFEKAIILGKYKTIERALEVLDEIQDTLKPRNLIYTGDKIHMKEAMHLCKMTNSQNISLLPENANITQLGILVYEMPKE